MGEVEEIQLLEARLNELKTAYEKYFAGVDKLEPAKLRDEVQKMVRRAGTLHITNTGLKFKRDSLIAHFNTFTQHWNRILKQIEDGTYSRDIFRMRLKDQERGTAGPQPPKLTPGKPAALDVDPEKMTQTQGRTPPGKPTSGPGPGGAYASVFLSLVEAKHKLGQPTENISYTALEKNLSAQAEAIKKKFRASRVDFTVEVKDGKPVIKAVPVK